MMRHLDDLLPLLGSPSRLHWNEDMSDEINPGSEEDDQMKGVEYTEEDA